jgi:AraC-like DNA-binding protein
LSPLGFDARIGKTLEWIQTHPGAEPDGAALASLAHLSPSRFTHLFRQQTGLSLSRYLLWARLLDAVAAVARGDNMTSAAHQAGFADLAHMSRTFRGTFGVVPSELNKMTIAFKRTGN